MKNAQQQSTTIDKYSDDPYDELDEQYRIAIDLKLEGMRYFDIRIALAEKFKYDLKEQTIRNWFSKNGMCDKAYQWKKRIRGEEREKRFRNIDKQIEDLAADAIITLKGAIKKGNALAAIEALKMAGFEKPKKYEVTNPIDIAERILSRYDSQKKIDSQKEEKSDE